MARNSGEAFGGGGGGGGSTPGAAQVLAFPFTFDTPDLLTGATVYTPTIDDVLLDAWIEIDTPWDGTTPLGDVGMFVGTADGGFINCNSPIDMSLADDFGTWGNGTASMLAQHFSSPSKTASNLTTAQVWSSGAPDVANLGLRVLPAKFATADPIKVCVSQDGTNSGADPGSTQGAAVLYLVVARPASSVPAGVKWGLAATSNFTSAGDPNGVVTAFAAGDLCVDTSTPALWQAAGPGTVWTQIGAGGGSSLWTLSGGNQLQPDAPTHAALRNFRLAWGPGNRTLFEIWDDGGAAAGQFVDLNTPGDFNSHIGGAYSQTIGNGWNLAITGNSAVAVAGELSLGATLGIVLENGTKLFDGAGDPNGTVTAPEGSIFLDNTTPALWQNTNGGTVWTRLGNASSFIDDGNHTGATTISVAAAAVHRVRLTGNITVTLTGAVAGEADALTVYLVQDGTGARTVTWPASVKWAFGVVPVLSTVANATDCVVLETFDGGTTWFASLAGRGYA